MFKKFLTGSLFLALLFISFSDEVCHANKVDTNIVATVDGEEINESELIFYYNKYGKNNKEFEGENGKRKILDKLIEFKIMLAVSREYGEEKNPLFLKSYDNYIMTRLTELYKTNLANKVKVTEDDLQVAFVESNKSGKKMTKEEIEARKEELREEIILKKYRELLQKEIEKLKKKYKIKVHYDLIKNLDNGEDVDNESAIFEVNDRKISYSRLMTMVPRSVRHSPEERKNKKDFLLALIDQQIEIIILSNEAKRMKLAESNLFFKMTTKEFYEKLLVNMLDYNDKFNDDVYGHIKVSDEELEKYYSDNKEKLEEHASVLSIYQITFFKEEDAKACYDELKKGASFEDAVKKYEKKLTSNSFDYGQVNKKDLKVKFGEVVGSEMYGLKKGELSNIIKVGSVYVITKVNDIKNDSKVTFDDIKPAIRKSLTMKKSREAFDAYTDDLRNKADISIDEKIFKRVKFE